MPRFDTILISSLRAIDKQGTIFSTLFGLGLCLLLGAIDMATPLEYNFAFIYLLPVAITTWLANLRAGVLVAFICTALLSRYHVHEPLVASIWNNLSTLGVFSFLALTLSKIRHLLEVESTLSRIDSLTGVMNLRAFSELVTYELLRMQRESQTFSLAYFDVDNFKQVNDLFGHLKGDELLKTLVTCLSGHLRKTDVIARLGGDEFVIFFPATDQEAVKVVSRKIIRELNALLQANNWPTTISMGVLTCANGACDLGDIISSADRLMYEVKSAGKNDVLYAIYP